MGLGLILLGTVLALVGSFQFRKARSMSMLNLSVKLIYVSISLWAARTITNLHSIFSQNYIIINPVLAPTGLARN